MLRQRPECVVSGTALDRDAFVGLHERPGIFKLQLRERDSGNMCIPHFYAEHLYVRCDRTVKLQETKSTLV